MTPPERPSHPAGAPSDGHGAGVPSIAREVAGEPSGRAAGPDAPAGRSAAAWAWLLLPFCCLYVSFGTTLGFLGTGAPLILRVRGVDLAEVGLLQAINLPLGLTFLWATAIDRLRLPGLPHRLGWIVLMQALTVACLLGLAASEQAALPTLFAFGFATCVCVATMDVSLEALIVETVSPADRPAISSAKFCGVSLGGILGAGAIVGSYDRLGWVAAVAAVAVLAALSLLPILLYPERRRRCADAIVERPGGRLGRLRVLGGHVLALGLYFAALHAISGLNGLALVDLGLPLASVGLLTGTVGPVLNLVMALLSAVLVRRFGTVPLITALAAGMLAASAAMAVAAASGATEIAVAATIGCYACASGLGVPVFNMLYRWSEGPRAATDYALLFGAAFFASMPVRVGGPAVASAIGWAAFFALAVPLYAGAFLVLRRAIVRTLASEKA